MNRWNKCTYIVETILDGRRVMTYILDLLNNRKREQFPTYFKKKVMYIL